MKYEVRTMKYKDTQKPEEIRQRCFTFAVDVINMCRNLSKDETNKILIRQVIRSSTSIAANLEEARGSKTRAEFINCTNISKKEARETYYWLRLIREINNIQIKNDTESLLRESDEIVRILTASVKKLQNYDQNKVHTS